MNNIYRLRKTDIKRRRNGGHPATCDCGCGARFKINDEVVVTKRSRGFRLWRTPLCEDRLSL